MAATKLDGPHLPGLLGDTLDWPFFEDRHRRFAAELLAEIGRRRERIATDALEQPLTEEYARQTQP